MRFSISIILYLCFLHASISQTGLIRGRIYDSATGEALPGATIVQPEGISNSISDAQGFFEINLPDSSWIRISFIGYTSEERLVLGHEFLQIGLKMRSALIDEFVVTALNLKRTGRSLGYSYQSIGPGTIAEVPALNFIDNLNSRFAGVNISQGASGMGSSSKIYIRGEASFTNNEPLFVIDGVPVSNQTDLNSTNETAAGFQEVDFGNRLMDLPADDIASVSVLKGPGAASLYGTRASNGVIIINTKEGKNESSLGIDYSTSLFIDRPFKLPEFQNIYGQGNSGKFAFADGLGGGVNDNISYSWGPRLDQGLQVAQYDSPVQLPDGQVLRGGDVAVHGGLPITPTSFVSYPDNLKDFYVTGITAINHLAVHSGFEKGNYRFSFTDSRGESFIPGVDLDRKSLGFRLDFLSSDKLSFTSSAHYLHSSAENRPSSGYGSENINYSIVAWGPRSLDISRLKDYWQPGLEGIQQYSFNYTFFDNPYFILKENRNSFERDRWFGRVSMDYKLSTNFLVRINSGLDQSSDNRSFLRNFSTNRFKTGAYAEQYIRYQENNTSLMLNYQDLWEDWHFELDAGANRMDRNTKYNQTEALSLAQAGIFNFSNAASPVAVGDFRSRKRINSVFGLLKLGLRNFLFLEITGRNDWSSALASPVSSENVSFFYPSVSLGLVLTEMMVLPKFISFSKFRLSGAQAGNDTEPYQTSAVFVSGIPYNSQASFSAQTVVPNDRLLPEKTASVETGIDLRFLDDRFRLDLSYYNSLTENQIISLPVPISSGYEERIVNGGSVRSKGIEIIAGISPLVGKDLFWDMQINFSHNVSRVESLPENAGRITLAYSRIYDNINQTVWFQVEEGGKIGDMYGTGYLKNEKGRFILSSTGNFIPDNNLKYLGNYNPDFMMGMSQSLSYKNWKLGILFDWRKGGILVSRTLSLAAVGGQLIETAYRPEAGILADGLVNTGSPDVPVWSENTIAIPAERYYRQYYDRNHEENNVYDASYLKLRQFSLGYTFHQKKDHFLFRQGQKLSIQLVGRNLISWSEIPHFDPEQLAIQGNRFIRGVEDMSYPSSRSLGFRIEFSF